MRSVLRFTLVMALSAFFSAANIAWLDINAQAQSCSALKAQLAVASRVGNSAQYRRYNNALVKQQRELSRAANLFQNSCGNRVINAQCRNLSATIRQMRANVVKLKGQRDRFGNQRLSNLERRRLEARIDRACSGRNVTVVARRGDTSRPNQVSAPQTRPLTNSPGSVGPLIPAMGYRTLCVREDDGYFFPISFSSRQEAFRRDAAICQAICPALTVSLYTHPAGDDAGVEVMVSLDGKAYVDQPYAFAYHSKPSTKRRACGAPDLAKLRELGYVQQGDQITGSERNASDRLPIVQKRPDRFSDPETQANGRTSLNPDSIRNSLNKTKLGVPVEMSRGPGRVRVVLPALLPDPATAIDLAAPDPTAVQ